MLTWFDHHPLLHGILLAALSLGASALALRTWVSPGLRGSRWSDGRWSVLILLLLAIGRSPTWWVTHELNVDESQFIAGALALRHDPVFWRSLETTTSGPLNTYVLLPFGTLLGGDTYFSARVTAALLVGFSLILAHRMLVPLYGRAVARVAVLPALLFESFTLHDDFLHYSSELMPMALLAAGLYLWTRRLASGGSLTPNLIGGLALGAVPLAKLQAAPLAAFIGLTWVAVEAFAHSGSIRERVRALAVLVTGALLPIAIFASMAVVTGQWIHAVTSYIANNLWYVEDSPLAISAVLADMSRQTLPSAQLKPWLAGTVLLLAAAACTRVLLSRARNSKAPPPPNATPNTTFRSGPRWAGCVFLLALVAVAVLCIVSPRRPFPHYWQLAVVPVTLLLGHVLAWAAAPSAAAAARRLAWIVPVALVVAVVTMVGVRILTPHPYLGRLHDMLAHPRVPVAAEIARLAPAAESLSVWGWIPTYYVQNGLRPATRDVTTHWAIYPGPHFEYYQERYLSDLRTSRPPIFVDALPPGDDKRHETRFPALGDYVAEHYHLSTEIDGNRIYLRREDVALGSAELQLGSEVR